MKQDDYNLRVGKPSLRMKKTTPICMVGDMKDTFSWRIKVLSIHGRIWTE